MIAGSDEHGLAEIAGGGLHGVANEYLAASLCVLPASLAEKRPTLPTWKSYQSRLPTESQIASWFTGDVAVCVLTGAVSGNLELIDFDSGGELFDAWRDLVESQSPGMTARLMIERSQSGGRHVVYRCQSPVPGNQKLAQRRMEVTDASPVAIAGKTYVPRRSGHCYEIVFTLIETRGEGGLFLCAPSPGYVIEQGGFNDIPIITDSERSILIDAASSLTEVYEPDLPSAPAKPYCRPEPGAGGVLPGDDFNERGDVREILMRHGWQLARPGDNEQWRRPGKTHGASATLKGRVFYVFSSNAAPFEPTRAYSPFSVYAILEHDGDFSAAASSLMADGFGRTPPPSEDVDLSNLIKKSQSPQDKPIQEFAIKSVGSLVSEFPELRRPVIHGLLREGETMNVIASPKVGKSWMVIDLALTIATGGDWLGTYKCERGDVLIIDNELHCETSANRIPKVMKARGITMPSVRDHVFVANVRGSLRDIHAMGRWFATIEPGRFKMIVLDAFYRFMPKDTDENDNGAMASVYNTLDSFAAQLGCSFVLVHHASKGNQSGKSVTDVGAGAGSQSRATDTHLVLRPHATDDVVVLDAAVRSWPPVSPRCLRWAFPLWTPDESLDPAELRPERPRRAKEPKPPKELEPPAWNVERFVEAFITDRPITIPALRAMTAERPDLSWRHAADLIEFAEAEGLVERQKLPGRGGPVAFVRVRTSNSGGEQ